MKTIIITTFVINHEGKNNTDDLTEHEELESYIFTPNQQKEIDECLNDLRALDERDGYIYKIEEKEKIIFSETIFLNEDPGYSYLDFMDWYLEEKDNN